MQNFLLRFGGTVAVVWGSLDRQPFDGGQAGGRPDGAR
jgi:hypothetical protein